MAALIAALMAALAVAEYMPVSGKNNTSMV
jgi:hypothetical protein